MEPRAHRWLGIPSGHAIIVYGCTPAQAERQPERAVRRARLHFEVNRAFDSRSPNHALKNGGAWGGRR
jgi:hypothetical protein